MPALVAMRFNPDLKRKYAALRDAGKPAKVALIALMRKLLETANALVKQGYRIWPQRPGRHERIKNEIGSLVEITPRDVAQGAWARRDSFKCDGPTLVKADRLWTPKPA